MTNPFDTAGLFLVQVLFDLYIFIILLRILLQFFRANFHNPICQFIMKVTNPLLLPLRKVIPGYWGIDFAAVLLVLIFQVVKLLLLIGLKAGLIFPHPAGLMLWAIGGLISHILNIFFYGIIIQIILSWINPGQPNPLNEILYLLTEPFLGRARRLIPPISGFDISPIPVLIFIKLIAILMVDPMVQLGAVHALTGM